MRVDVAYRNLEDHIVWHTREGLQKSLFECLNITKPEYDELIELLGWKTECLAWY